MRLAAGALVVALLVAGCGDDDVPAADPSTTTVVPAPTGDASATTSAAGDPSTTATAADDGDPGPVEALTVEVIETYPHDEASFTQGLEVAPDGTVLESAGLYGQSDVRRVDLASGEVLERASVDPELFAEGLTQVGGELIQLTWQEHTAIVYDAETLEPTGSFTYEGEGWGLCLMDDRLVMSNGSERLTFRDPATFEPLGEVEVTFDGEPVARLNELECVGGDVWANVWQTDTIVRIDPTTGAVTGVVDAAGLLDRDEYPSADVLNGIAHDAESGTFLITGKLWPTVYRVDFVPA